jgi:hypothetical protein
MPSDIPSPAELENNIAKLYKAEISHDWRTWYSLTSVEYKKHFSFKEFEPWATKDIDYRIVSWRIKDIKSITDPEEKLHNVYSVAVEMDVVVKKKWWSEPITIKDTTDYWLYIDNSWGWMWRGFPKD